MSITGKLVLLTALLAQSILIMADELTKNNFENKYAVFQNYLITKNYVSSDTMQLFPSVLAQKVIAGLIASSVLMCICRYLFFLPLIGLSLQAATIANPKLNDDLNTFTEFLRIIAFIGGVLLWSSNCEDIYEEPEIKVKPE